MKNEKQHPKFLKKIDWKLLKKQKVTLFAVIEFCEKNKFPEEFINDLDGILNLIDTIQDYAVDKMGESETNVFGFEEEEKHEGKNPQKLWLCTKCNSDNVETKSWTNLNTNEISGECSEGDEDDNWCKDCGEHNPVYLVGIAAGHVVIGFQVVINPNSSRKDADDGIIHPEMKGSFCIYSLSQARKMINGNTNDWQLLAIWTNDIEEPTFMFEGDPRQ